jgi:hypothetical protein
MEPVQDRGALAAAWMVAVSLAVAIAAAAMVIWGGGVGQPLQASPSTQPVRAQTAPPGESG